MLRAGTKAIATIAALIFLSGGVSSRATAADRDVCDITADLALGQEDYATAVTLHRKILSSHPNDALAHYHLGFAYGMTGQLRDEISEYLVAAKLGLNKWDLFLNLGLAYLGQKDWPKAISSLRTAVLLGPAHPEAHFNLEMAYEGANASKGVPGNHASAEVGNLGLRRGQHENNAFR